MKISILIAEGEKQIMMTPETDHERQALKFISPGSELKAVSKIGTYDDSPSHAGYQSLMSQGGNFRRYAQEESLMFIISNEKENDQH